MAKSRKEGNKSSSKSKSKKEVSLDESVITLFKKTGKNILHIEEMVSSLRLKSRPQKAELTKALAILKTENKINFIGDNSYQICLLPKFVLEGIVDHVNSRYAFIICPDSKDDIMVSSGNLCNAIDGDRVRVNVFAEKGKKPEGEVIEILERKKKELVGKVDLAQKFAFVVPDNKKFYTDIYVRLQDLNGASNGDKVIVQITQYPSHDRKPEGKITKVLGKAGEHDTEMHSIMAEYGLPFEFPDEVLKEAKSLPTLITKEDCETRTDFRKITTFTVDPIDAKDFDDALSVRFIDDTTVEIGVHIADVTHYVPLHSELEKEAYKRATSVYLVDRVVPMLPENLSNGLCSLRPNEDKLTFSAVFEMNMEGKVLKTWIGKTIIHSDKRFSYEDAQEIIDGNVDGPFKKEILLLNDLAIKIRGERFKEGAINFETIEVKFLLDEKGKPLGVYPKIRKEAHKLIEEFMLMANKKVAQYVYGLKKSDDDEKVMVYRTHDDPDPEKLKTLSQFARRFGYEFKSEEKGMSKSLNKFVDSIEGKPEQNVLQNLAIRTMAKAKYTTASTGHFGLAFDHYTHFTSPIRRYPDMMAHRLLFDYLNKKNVVPTKKDTEEKCKHASDREKLAAEAERASIKYKQVEFMQNLEKETVLEGIVSGVTEWGLYVEMVETKCEGLVKMVDMNDDYYDLDPDNYRLVGRKLGRIIALGDPLKVRVKATDLDRRTIDLKIIEMPETYISKVGR